MSKSSRPRSSRGVFFKGVSPTGEPRMHDDMITPGQHHLATQDLTVGRNGAKLQEQIAYLRTLMKPSEFSLS